MALTKIISEIIQDNTIQDADISSSLSTGISGSFGSQRVGTTDNVQFNHITASGDISSSGTVFADNFQSTGGDSEGISFTDDLSDEVIDTWGFIGDESYDETDPSQISIRRLVKPRQNYTLVSFDYSQMEVRVFLSYLENETIVDLLSRNDVDFHGETAKIAFGLDEDNDEFKFYRQMAKNITFGIIYGIGSQKLSQQLRTSQKEAASYKKKYLDSIEGSRKFIRGVMDAVEKRGWIKNRYGRVYKIPADMSYKGINYLVQGTSADILNERLIKVYEYLEDKKSNVLLQVHDEIICEVHDSELQEVSKEIVDIMQQNSLDIPLFVDKEVCSPSWANKVDFEKWMTNRKEPDIVDYLDWN